MRRLGACGLTVTLVLGLGGATVLAGDVDAGGDDAEPAAKASSSWWNPTTWWETKEKKPEKKIAAKTEKKVSKKPTAVPKATSVVDEAAAERAREEALLLRRLQVCDKLMEIAVRTNNNDLLRRAEELDERARTAYAQHTAYLRSSSASDLDDQILEKHLSASNAAKSLLPDGSTGKAAAKARLDRAAGKEVQQ
jgi:hypothetical protein